VACRTHAGRSRDHRLGRPEPRPAEAERGQSPEAGAKRWARNAIFRRPPQQCTDRGGGEVRRPERRQGRLDRRRWRAL